MQFAAVVGSLIRVLLKGCTTASLLFFIRCSNGYEDGWAWGVTTENGERETGTLKWSNHEVVVVDNVIMSNRHKVCKKRHYRDPYTKKEYCLPEDFANMEILHLYLVKD